MTEAGQLVFGNGVTGDHERLDPVRDHLVRYGDDGALDDGRMQMQRRLDVTELDAIPAALDLRVAATEEDPVSTLVQIPEVAGPVHEVPVRILVPARG